MGFSKIVAVISYQPIQLAVGAEREGMLEKGAFGGQQLERLPGLGIDQARFYELDGVLPPIAERCGT
jgi:hypothetical protein